MFEQKCARSCRASRDNLVVDDRYFYYEYAFYSVKCYKQKNKKIYRYIGVNSDIDSIEKCLFLREHF